MNGDKNVQKFTHMVNLLNDHGYYMGIRVQTRNTDFPGKYMVAEDGDYAETTRDGSVGGYCIVGDDLYELIATTISFNNLGTIMCECEECAADGSRLPATRWMPQSSDQGKTVEYMACCAGHAFGWWDAADWQGDHLERPILSNLSKENV